VCHTACMPDALPDRLTLRHLRETAGLTLEQLADQADCHPGHLRQVEAGTRRPGHRLARRIAAVLSDHLGRPVDAGEFFEPRPPRAA
jgi:transcriptional regulator with XRE-family HTH domain